LADRSDPGTARGEGVLCAGGWGARGAERRPMMRRADFRGWFLLACCAAPLGGVSAQGALQLGGQPPKQIEMELCTIGDVFGKVNQITSDPSCRAGCAGGTGECPDPTWMPAAADECNPQCGQIFEPFWCVRNGPHSCWFYRTRRYLLRSASALLWLVLFRSSIRVMDHVFRTSSSPLMGPNRDQCA
jgi:hypothetical protein